MYSTSLLQPSDSRCKKRRKPGPMPVSFILKALFFGVVGLVVRKILIGQNAMHFVRLCDKQVSAEKMVRSFCK